MRRGRRECTAASIHNRLITKGARLAVAVTAPGSQDDDTNRVKKREEREPGAEEEASSLCSWWVD
jgi:hypothetical protein